MQSITQKQMSFKEVLAYSLGLCGFQTIVGLLNSYQAEFYNASMGASLTVVGIIILVAKIVSAIFDPIVGNMIEKKNSKHGKLKPFILYSLAPLFVFTILIFIKVPLSGTALYVYIFITFLCWCLAMTLGDVPSQGIACVLTTNPEERTNVISIANTLKQVGYSACAVFVPIVCLIIPGGSQVFGFEGEADSPISNTEYLVTAIVVSVLGCAMFSLIFFWNKERVPYEAQKMSFREMFEILKDNKPLLMVVISYFLGFGRQLRTGIQVQAASALLGSQNYVVLLGIATAVGSMVSMALCPILVKKFDEKKVFIAMSLFGFVISVIGYFVGTSNMVVMFIFLFLMGLPMGAATLLPMIFTADCVDYYEHKSGKRTEGVAYAVLSLTIKISLAMGTALGLVFVSISGYDASSTAGFSDSTKDIIYFAYTALPGIFSLLAIFPMLKYKIFGAEKERISKELNEKRRLNK